MDQHQIIEKLKLDLQLRGYSKGTEKDYSQREVTEKPLVFR